MPVSESGVQLDVEICCSLRPFLLSLFAVIAGMLLLGPAASAGPFASQHIAQSSQPNLDQAMAAELLRHPGSVPMPAGVPLFCPAVSPGLCANPYSSEAQAARGIAQFGIFDSGAPAGLGESDVLAMAIDGSWKFWEQTGEGGYRRYQLPGDIRACAGGDGLNVRSDPSASSAAVTLLADGAVMTAERFVLTDAGSATLLLPGSGWYQISSPAQGWVNSNFTSISNATFVDCSRYDRARDRLP
jgi:hypothetical protein